MEKLPVLYSSDHQRHYPTVEFFHGRLVPLPEIPTRIENIKAAFEASGLAEFHEPEMLISKEQLAQTHDLGMVEYLEEISTSALDFLRAQFRDYGYSDEDISAADYYYPYTMNYREMVTRQTDSVKKRPDYYFLDTSVPIGVGTWPAAHRSASLAMAGAEILLEGKARAAYALCRPPGHHAGRDFIGGFCYLNNAAIAANRLAESGRVAILDVDYHHGNGTQAIFWERPDVFFASLHGDPSYAYPHYAGYADETGGASAPNTNLNLPLPAETGPQAFMQAHARALDAIDHFQPAHLVVSVGFDTYKNDPLGVFKLEEETYNEIGAAINSLGLPTLFIQEGGYAVNELGKLAVALVEGYLNH